MSAPSEVAVQAAVSRSGLGFFERWLTLWVGLCIVAGIVARPICAGILPG